MGTVPEIARSFCLAVNEDGEVGLGAWIQISSTMHLKCDIYPPLRLIKQRLLLVNSDGSCYRSDDVNDDAYATRYSDLDVFQNDPSPIPVTDNEWYRNAYVSWYPSTNVHYVWPAGIH